MFKESLKNFLLLIKMDNTLKTFHTICMFVKQLKDVFSNEHPLVLYNRILEKTPITNSNAINKQISIFSEFLNKNKTSILSKDCDKFVWTKIMFSNKIFINLKDIISKSDKDTKETIWKYLLTISYLITNDIEFKQKLQPNSSENADGSEEDKFIKNFMNKIENKFEGKEYKDPMTATADLLQSGLFSEMIQTINTDLSSGKLNMPKLLQSVQGMMGGQQMPDISGMMSGMMNMMGNMDGNMGGNMNGNTDVANIDTSALGGMMSGLMGNLMNGGGMGESMGGGMMSSMMGSMMSALTQTPTNSITSISEVNEDNQNVD